MNTLVLDNDRTAPPPVVDTGSRFIFGLLAVVILVFTALAEIVSWTLDETHYLGYTRVSGSTRMTAVAGFLAVLLLVLVVLSVRLKNPYQRAVFRLWALATAFSLLLSLARLPGLKSRLESQFLQVLIEMVVFMVLLRLPGRSQGLFGKLRFRTAGLPFSMFIAGCLALPWIAIGALGSIWDTLLSLLVGVLFGLIAARSLIFFLFEPVTSLFDRPGTRYGMTSFAAVIALAVMTIGLQTSGLQAYLLMVIPFLGLVDYAIFLANRPVPANQGAAEDDPSGMGKGSPWLPSAAILGISAAAALIFVDQKELSLVVGSGPGEILQWVLDAGLASLGVAVIAGVAGSFGWRRLSRWGSNRRSAAAAGFIWVAAVGFFTLAGRSALYGDRLFVILRSQADVSSAASMTDYNERRTYVYQTLTSQTEKTQAALRADLTRYHIGFTPYYLVNGLEVRGGPLIKIWLQSRPEVDRVLTEPILRPLPETLPTNTGTDPAPTGVLWNQKLVGADRVWNELHVTGQGIVVGQSDSGVQASHPELSAGYRGQSAGDAFNWLDPWNHTSSPVDDGGHGTHTLGIAVGKKTGIAPGATWFACVNEARNMGNPADYLNCMQFMLAPYPQGKDPLHDGDPTRSANVINNSWGCPDLEGCDPASLRAGVNALQAAGIFVVASVGNSGQGGCGTVTDPLAIYPNVISVGSVNNQGQLSNFSSLGPVNVDGSGRTKPDLIAPGEDVLSAFPGSTYAVESGTSMAGPHVVGVVALMWSANPKLIGQVERTVQILEQTADPYKGDLPSCVRAGQGSNNAAGFGTVNAYAAVKMALAAK